MLQQVTLILGNTGHGVQGAQHIPGVKAPQRLIIGNAGAFKKGKQGLKHRLHIFRPHIVHHHLDVLFNKQRRLVPAGHIAKTVVLHHPGGSLVLL